MRLRILHGEAGVGGRSSELISIPEVIPRHPVVVVRLTHRGEGNRQSRGGARTEEVRLDPAHLVKWWSL